MKYGRKMLPVHHAKALEGSEGLVEAYCSVFNNVDFAGEIIRPGAFADTINEANTQAGKTLPKILWSHNMWDQPVGLTKEAEEVLPYDSRLPAPIRHLGGLRVVGHFNLETAMGRDTFSNIKFGALDKYSIGYFVLVDQFDRETGIVELMKLDWLEWSPVNFAANEATLTVDAKSAGGIGTEEHVFSVHQPTEFVDGSFRREIKERNGISYVVVTGKLRATGATEQANLRFDADAWSARNAKSFCLENGRGTFIAATKVGGASDGESESEEESGNERLADHGARVVAQLSAYIARVEDVKSKRLAEGKAGRVLSEANRNILASLLPDLANVTGKVQKLLDDTAQSESDDGKSGTDSNAASKDELRKMHARALALQAEMTATELEEIAS